MMKNIFLLGLFTLCCSNAISYVASVVPENLAHRNSRCTALWVGCNPSSANNCCPGSVCIKDDPSWALGICKPGGGGGSQCTSLWAACRTESSNCCPGSSCIKDVPSWAEGICKPGGGGGGGGSVTSPPQPGGNALVTSQEFSSAVTSCGYPAPRDDQYRNVVNKAGPNGKIVTKRELAMFLANVIQETGGLQVIRENTQNPNAYDGHGPSEEYWPGISAPGKLYYGRGYMQLSWPSNYFLASRKLYGDGKKLLNNPDLVEQDQAIAWDTAFWFWSDTVRTAPGVSQGHFGATINAINGNLECQGAHQDMARRRFGFYKKVLTAFRVTETPIETGCYN